VTMTASVIPKIPKKFPVLDVSGEERPRNAIMNNMPVTKYRDAVILAEIISFYFFCTFSTFYELLKNPRKYL